MISHVRMHAAASLVLLLLSAASLEHAPALQLKRRSAEAASSIFLKRASAHEYLDSCSRGDLFVAWGPMIKSDSALRRLAIGQICGTIDELNARVRELAPVLTNKSTILAGDVVAAEAARSSSETSSSWKQAPWRPEEYRGRERCARQCS